MTSPQAGAHELTEAQAAARLRQARISGLRDYPWPHVPLTDSHAALESVAATAHAALEGETSQLERTSLDALDVACFMSGMGPLLGWWMKRGLITCDDAIADRLRLHLHHGRARGARMAAALRHAIDVLHAAGIPVTVLKGAHTSFVCFDEPGLRPMADLDLLVPAQCVAAAERTLQDAGCIEYGGGRRRAPYRSMWQPPGAPVSLRSLTVHHEENPFTIDLHASLDIGQQDGLVRVETPAARVAAPWAGDDATALPPLHLIAHVATHASRGPFNLTLIRLTELVLLMRMIPFRLQERDLLPILESNGLARFRFPALELAERFVPGTISPAVRELLTAAAHARLRRFVAAVSPAAAAHPLAHGGAARLMWVGGPLDLLRHIRYYIAPVRGRDLAPLYLDRLRRLGRVALRK